MTEPIPYASLRDPGGKAASPWPLILLVLLALGLITLGGCFCIGLLLLVQPDLVSVTGNHSSQLNDGQSILGIFLGFLATLCFLLGFGLSIALMRKLLRRV